jgi:hypothetical protein
VSVKAGPELDALVAEKVMGWKVWQASSAVILFDRGTGKWTTFSPSTGIVSAWEVLERLREIWEIEMGGCPTPLVDARHASWGVRLNPKVTTDDRVSVEAQADTAPLAICLAALQAAEEEVRS